MPEPFLVGQVTVATRLLYVVYLAIGLLIALVVHEFAHAFVAYRLGDYTPRLAGRMSLDPRRHADPFGTLLLPGILLLPRLFGAALFPVFAYAKPQPLNPSSLRNPDRDPVLVAVAGLLANLLLAFVFGGLIRLAALSGVAEAVRFLHACLSVNLTFAILHIIPFPPLDGSRVLARFLSGRAREVYMSWDPYGALFILVIFFIFPGPIFAFVRVIAGGICSMFGVSPCV
ncbi:MAG: site-2 protease family protein [Actinomycetota bacterium]|nr:site-2 protease family protein [Actinomycetota bacterium]